MSPRRKIVIAALAVAGPLALTVFTLPNPILLWNASASAPIGLYRVLPIIKLEVTELVVARPPAQLANLLDARGYLPRGVALIKRVLGLPGQVACRHGSAISVDGIDMGLARESDHAGRALPAWQGCHQLGDGEVFLMNRDEPASLDGRYFGPVPVSSIVGRAEPLWIVEEQR
jgi:conjugative transfer signal peptidase TraF